MISTAVRPHTPAPSLTPPDAAAYINADNRDYRFLGERVAAWVGAEPRLIAVLAAEAGVPAAAVAAVTTAFGEHSLGHNRVTAELKAALTLRDGRTCESSVMLKCGAPHGAYHYNRADAERELHVSQHLEAEYPQLRRHLAPTLLAGEMPAATAPIGVEKAFRRVLPVQADRFIDAPELYAVKKEIERRHIDNSAERRTAVCALLHGCLSALVKIWDTTRTDGCRGVVFDAGNDDILVRVSPRGSYTPVFIDPDCFLGTGGVSALTESIESLVSGTNGVWAYRGFSAPRRGYWNAERVCEAIRAGAGARRAKEIFELIAAMPPQEEQFYLERMRLRAYARRLSA